MNKKIFGILAALIWINGNALSSNFSIEIGGNFHVLGANNIRNYSSTSMRGGVVEFNNKMVSITVPGYDVRAGIYYKRNSFEIGLLAGFGQLSPFNPAGDLKTSSIHVPINLSIRYFITETNRKLLAYSTLRAGISISFDDYAENLTHNLKRRMIGVILEYGLGLEFYNVQLEIFSFERVCFTHQVTTIYISQGISCGIGYIFRDIF